MIAKIYFLVGTVQYSNEYGIPNAFAFPTRIFDANEEQQAIREYERLAKRNYDIGEAFQEAYVVKMVGEAKTVIKGNVGLVEPYL